MSRFALLPCLLAATLAVVAAAEEAPPLVTDRPTQTYSALTVPPAMIQNELGFTHGRVDGATADALGEWSVRWGVARDLELNVLLGSFVWQDAPGAGSVDGWTDSRLGLKWTSQHGDGPRPTAALLLGTSLPTGGEAYREDTLQPEAVIVMEWALGGRFALGSNVGYGWASQDLERFHRWWGSLVLSADLGGGVAAFAEGFGYRREEPGGASTGYLDAGLTWGLSPSLQLDARAGLGRNGRDEEWFVGVGAAWRGRGP
jgi:hypothetical protein